MERDIVNNPYKSHWIGRMFIILTVFTAFIFILVYYYVGLESQAGQNFVGAIMLGTLLMVLIVTGSFYNTKYRIKGGVLTSWSPFMFIKIRLDDIKSVEKTMFPFGFRVGASFYCGVYYIPSLGWTRVIITNMRDVVLIKTKDGKKYIISPKNPQRFMKTIKK
ncbi:MAG: PH domain-containing protein [Candidatus Aenigmatarchaeota archaeon]